MNTPHAMRCQAFALHKRDHPAEDYEDASDYSLQSGRFAVADGASESSFARPWAKLLTDNFVNAGLDRELVDWLKPLRQRWATEVDGIPLPWYAEEKRELGAFGTFLGLAVEKSASKPGGRWRAWAVGDSCLFQVRHNDLCQAFPLGRACEFSNQPSLLCSRAGVRAEPVVQQTTGFWVPGDLLFLMTDALAQWFLSRHEAKRIPWHSLTYRLAAAHPDVALAAYVDKLRAHAELRNDDVTLLALYL